MTPTAIDRLSPLAANLRSENPDYYLSTLFAPPSVREALVAIYAFDSEIARVHKLVREPVAGLIRLQWWDEIIDRLVRGETVAHPVVEGLQHVVAAGSFDVGCLKRAIDGRRRPFESDAPSDIQSFKSCLTDVGGGVTGAAAMLLGASGRDMLVLADQVGSVRAAWEQIRLIETSTSDQRPWLPPEWLEDGGAERNGAMSGSVSQRVAEWALAALANARRQCASIPRPLLPAFFPGTLAGARLRDLNRASRRPMLPTAVPRLIWGWMRSRY